MFGIRAASLVAVLALQSASAAWAGMRDDPDALWRVVHSLCVTDKSLTGLPAPCLSVDRARGVAVVPDPGTRTQVLLVPLRRIAGIESPELLAPDAPNYWDLAWQARTYVERRARRSIPRDRLALAVNSTFGRTQRQLHIHVDCVRPSVREALVNNLDLIKPSWTWFPHALMGHRYRVMRLDGEALGERDPFRLLADGDREARAGMGAWTLVVIGQRFAHGPGFVVLAARGGTADNPDGSGEDLLDHRCAVLRAP